MKFLTIVFYWLQIKNSWSQPYYDNPEMYSYYDQPRTDFQNGRLHEGFNKIEFEMDRMSEMSRSLKHSLYEFNTDLEYDTYHDDDDDMYNDKLRFKPRNFEDDDKEKPKMSKEDRQRLIRDIDKAESMLKKDHKIYRSNMFSRTVSPSPEMDEVIGICENAFKLKEEMKLNEAIKRASYKCAEMMKWLNIFINKDSSEEVLCPYGEFIINMKLDFYKVGSLEKLSYFNRLPEDKRKHILNSVKNNKEFKVEGKRAVKNIGALCAKPGGTKTYVDTRNGEIGKAVYGNDEKSTIFRKYDLERENFHDVNCQDPLLKGTVITGFVMEEGGMKLVCGSFLETPYNKGNFTELRNYIDQFSIQQCEYPYGLCGVKGGYKNDKDIDPPTIRCCPLPREGMNCDPKSKYETVVECDARGSETPVSCNYDKTIGTSGSKATTKSNSQAITFGKSWTFDVTASTSATVGVFSLIKITAGLNANFGLRGGSSTTSSSSWSSSSRETWSETKSYSVSTTAPPGQIQTIKQFTGHCAFFNVQSSIMKMITSEFHKSRSGNLTRIYKEIYFDGIKDPAPEPYLERMQDEF